MPGGRTQPGTELVRGFGLLQASALNMSNMVGIGPFITIPAMLATMGGPQAMLGWLLGTVLAVCDGLVWSELAAALPGAGTCERRFVRAVWGCCCRSCLSGSLSGAARWR